LFEELARSRSDCRTSADDGGRLGQVTHDQTVAEFEAGLARMREAIVETRYGFHVVRLDHHAPGQVLPFELARERIADYLATGVQRRALAQYVSVLAGRADIAGVALAGANSPLVQLGQSSPDLLVFNKFGKAECEGGGLLDLIAGAMERRVAVVIGVPQGNLAAWRSFAGDLAVELSADVVEIESWVERL